MAVAKSYENMEIIGEPFESNGRMYVRVRGNCKRCGGSGHYSMNAQGDSTCYRCNGRGKEDMEVRWYTNKQREALDRAAEKRAAAKEAKIQERHFKFAARNAFGFGEAGFITLFKGDSTILNEWAHETNPCRARYNTLFGWFCPSKLEIVNLPAEITPIVLKWDDVRNLNDPENLTMRDDAEVSKLIHELLDDLSKSEYQGEVGDWLEREVTIKKNVPVDGRFGESRVHIMEDTDGNEYVWITASKNLEVGYKCIMRMKVKEHKEYNGVKQTVVYYCKMKG